MDIIHILQGKANPNTLNGVNKVVDAIASEQVSLGYKTMVVGMANNTIERHNPNYHYKLFKKSVIPFCYPSQLLTFLLDNSTTKTVFHFHSVFILWFLPLIKALKKNDRNHVFLTPHGQYIDIAMNSIRKRIAFHFFDSKVLKEVEAVHIIGYQTENNERIQRYAQRIAVIPNGFGQQIVKQFPKSESLVFGYMGRLECKQKGLDILIPAFIQYIQNGGQGNLKIAGSGPDHTYLEKIVQNSKMENRITFVGKLFDDDKWRFLQECSVFLHPSHWDVIPTVCMEAASVGTPLFVSEDTNLGEYITKYGAGKSITKVDIESIAKGLSEFDSSFKTSTWTSMCEGAKKMIEAELNWKRITKKIINELYCFETD